MLCRIFSPMRAHLHQQMGTRIQYWALEQLRLEKHIEDPSLRGEEIRLPPAWLVSLHVQQDPASMSVVQRSVV